MSKISKDTLGFRPGPIRVIKALVRGRQLTQGAEFQAAMSIQEGSPLLPSEVALLTTPQRELRRDPRLTGYAAGYISTRAQQARTDVLQIVETAPKGRERRRLEEESRVLKLTEAIFDPTAVVDKTSDDRKPVVESAVELGKTAARDYRFAESVAQAFMDIVYPSK